MDKTPKN